MRKHYTIFALCVGIMYLLSCAPTPSPAQSQEAVSKPAITVLGEWKEYWGTPGETDVTYHDQYRVTQASNGDVKVEILNRDQKIYDEELNGKLLTFTQRTDAYIVKYSLTLQKDGGWMIGTATTPQKSFDVKWERTK